MFERFSDGARRVVFFAEEAARDLNHKAVGTEHLLIALTKLEGSPSQEILLQQGYSEENIRGQIVKGKLRAEGRMDFTKQAKQALADTLRVSLDRNGTTLEDVDILLALVRQKSDSNIVAVLKDLSGPNAVSKLQEKVTRQLQVLNLTTRNPEDKSESMLLLSRILQAIQGHSDDDLQQILQFVQLASDERQRLLDSID